MADDPEDIYRRALAAEALLRNETLQAAFAAVEQEAILAWKLALDPVVREHLWHRVRAADQLRAKLQGWCDEGAVIRKKLGNDI